MKILNNKKEKKSKKSVNTEKEFRERLRKERKKKEKGGREKKKKERKEQYGEPASKEKIGNIFIADLLRNMAKHVMEQLETSFNSLLDNDEQLANTALEMDFTTNNMVDNVRTSVETMVSVGYNYQFSKSILYTEVASDLERIGDYCGHIAKFAANEIFEIDEDILANMRNMYKTSQKMIRSSMIAFLENKTDLKEEVMAMEETLHYLQAQSVNLIAVQMAENTFEEKERSNYFIKWMLFHLRRKY